jgi:pimeloyl-ACP methyl ester carboxylesterase
MAKPINVIYLPGLGDHHSYGQRLVVFLWRLRGSKGHDVQLNWADGQPFKSKLERIVMAIDKAAAKNGTVSLVGISAGASAAFNAYGMRKAKVSSLVYICGKVKNAQTVSKVTFAKNPAFKESLALLPAVLQDLTVQDKGKVLSVRPIEDTTVPVEDTVIAGIKEKVIPTHGHVRSIAYAITIGFGPLSKFIKERSKVSVQNAKSHLR